jgi:hypothetical protein
VLSDEEVADKKELEAACQAAWQKKCNASDKGKKRKDRYTTSERGRQTKANIDEAGQKRARVHQEQW